MTLKIVLLTIATITIIESLFLIAFPKATKNLLKDLSKSKNITKIGLIELATGIILLIISFTILN